MRIFPESVLVKSDEQKMLSIIVLDVSVMQIVLFEEEENKNQLYHKVVNFGAWI